MKGMLVSFFLLFFPSWGMAGSLPGDFAYGIPLSLKENSAVFRLSLPKEVYEVVCTEDLADIRVFTGEKRPVPHALRRPETDSGVSEETSVLPFFPLYRTVAEREAGELVAHIEKREDGTIIDVSSGASAAGEQKRVGYIIDASKAEGAVDALDILWGAESGDFVTTVSLEYSDDLVYWVPLVPEAGLARMRYGNQEITKKRIVVPSRMKLPGARSHAGGEDFVGGHEDSGQGLSPLYPKYLRLLWSSGKTGVDVRGIVAVRRMGAPEKVRSFVAPGGRSSSDENTVSYEYESPGRFPVDRIRLSSPEKNTLLKARIFSRPDQKTAWRYRQNGIFYQLSFDGVLLGQDTVPVALTRDRYWRVEIEGMSAGMPQKVPGLELGWLPDELLFLAQGEGPYVLAYGSTRLKEGEAAASNLLAQVVTRATEPLIRDAGLLSPVSLGGPDRLTPEPPPLPWRNWLLWAVLLAGVGVIAGMAWRLGKGLHAEKDLDRKE